MKIKVQKQSFRKNFSELCLYVDSVKFFDENKTIMNNYDYINGNKQFATIEIFLKNLSLV